MLFFQLPASKKPGKPLIISDIRKGSIAHRFVKPNYIFFFFFWLIVVQRNIILCELLFPGIIIVLNKLVL